MQGPAAEWLRWLITMALGAAITYGALRSEIDVMRVREELHYDEVVRRLMRIESKLDDGTGVGR